MIRSAGRVMQVAAAAAALTLPVVVSPAPAQASAAATGYDFSWPQCPKGDGRGEGKPLPTGTHAFEVVGLTNGFGLHENPCLASQWAYAKAHASYVTGYTMLTYPTAAQIRRSRTGHFGTCSTLDCRLRNNGWAQGDFADVSLRRIGARPPLVWIDVEPRPGQNWSSNRYRNGLVIKAVTASLRYHGYRVGIYSNTGMWRRIAGFSTTLPEWVPAGSTSSGCAMPFSGGPVYMSQDGYYDPVRRAGYDVNGMCGRAPSVARIYQPHRPWATSGVNRSGWALAHYTDGPWFGLAMRVAGPPAVARVVNPHGHTPLFVAINRYHAAYVRTLYSRWSSLRTGPCSATPSVTITGTSAWVGCRNSRTGSMTMTHVTLSSAGVPVGTTVADWGGALSSSPSVTISDGEPLAVAKFRDGLVYERTATTDWAPAASRGQPAPQATRAYIG